MNRDREISAYTRFKDMRFGSCADKWLLRTLGSSNRIGRIVSADSCFREVRIKNARIESKNARIENKNARIENKKRKNENPN